MSMLMFLASLYAYALPTEQTIEWWRFPVGFALFCAFVLISFYVKLQFTKKINERNYSEASFEAVSLDFLVVAINTIYAVWLYNFLFK